MTQEIITVLERPGLTDAIILYELIIPAIGFFFALFALIQFTEIREKQTSINHIKKRKNVISGVSNYRPPIYHNIHSRKSTVERRDRLKSSA